MSVEQNKAIVRRNYDELWNQRKFDLVDELYAPGSVSTGAGGDRPPGPDGFKQLMQSYLSSFPDLHFTVETMIAEGDYVATVWSVSGTYQGGALNLPASAMGQRTQQRGITVNRLKDGKIVEGFNSMDQLEMLKNLGVMG